MTIVAPSEAATMRLMAKAVPWVALGCVAAGGVLVVIMNAEEWLRDDPPSEFAKERPDTRPTRTRPASPGPVVVPGSPPKPLIVESKFEDGVEYRPIGNTGDGDLLDGMFTAMQLMRFCEGRAENPEAWKDIERVEIEVTERDRHVAIQVFTKTENSSARFRATRRLDEVIADDRPLSCGFAEAGKAYAVTDSLGLQDRMSFYCLTDGDLTPWCLHTIGMCEAERLAIAQKDQTRADQVTCKRVDNMEVRCVDGIDTQGEDGTVCTTEDGCSRFRSDMKRGGWTSIGRCKFPLP